MQNKIIWPERKPASAMVSIELDGEYMWLLLDPTNARRPKTLSMGTYGLYRGLDRMLESLKERGITATFFVPGIMAEKYPDDIKKVYDAGHEIALHGYMHENFAFLTPDEQRTAINKGIQALKKVTGEMPKGFRLPEGNMTPETLEIIKDAGFEYDSSMVDDDIPYMTEFGGTPSDMVEIPMRWEIQDFPYFAFNFFPPMPLGECRIASYQEAMDNWLTELEGYRRFGCCYVIKFDPQTIGTPARISMFDQVLDEMIHQNMWIATGREIADFYKNAIK